MQYPPLKDVPAVKPETVESVRREIAQWFMTSDTALDNPESGSFRFRGRPRWNPDREDLFPHILEVFEKYGFTAELSSNENQQIYLTGKPYLIQAAPMRWGVAISMYIATIFTTLMTGVLMSPEAAEIIETATTQQEAIQLFALNLWRGWPYALSIMTILTAHELGHFFAAMYHKVPASLPFFIPMPLPGIGTMGAVIFQRGPTRNIRAQFDGGAAGPLAGLVFAIPILIYGLSTSEVGPLPEDMTGLVMEGNSAIYATIKILLFGEFLPNGTTDVSLNMVAWAGWVGLLVTALNLIPVSPLDGGRVLQVVQGEEFMRSIYWPILIGLVAMGIILQANVWLVWAIMLYMFGNRYEKPLDTVTPLDDRRRFLAWFTFVLFLLLFVPAPLTIF
ncbi:MAG: site-2 protease family protein [Chloroflexota bacterium]